MGPIILSDNLHKSQKCCTFAPANKNWTKMINKNNDILLALKAARKQSRDAEIALYGKPICHGNVYNNKKKYTRKAKHKCLTMQIERPKWG